MLTPEERRLVYENAYLPEHIPDYVEAVSGAESHLQDHHLCFHWKGHLLFIGYPLRNRTANTPEAYELAVNRFKPATVAIIAPEIWLPSQTFEGQAEDFYFRLDLPIGSVSPGAAYMVRRAERELRVGAGKGFACWEFPLYWTG